MYLTRFMTPYDSHDLVVDHIVIQSPLSNASLMGSQGACKKRLAVLDFL